MEENKIQVWFTLFLLWVNRVIPDRPPMESKAKSSFGILGRGGGGIWIYDDLSVGKSVSGGKKIFTIWNIPQIYTCSVISSNQGAYWRLCSYDCSYGKIEVRCKCIATINKCGGTFLSITPRRQRDPWVPDKGDWFAHRSPQLDLIYVDNWRPNSTGCLKRYIYEFSLESP